MVTIKPLWESQAYCVDAIYHVQKSKKIISNIIFHLQLGNCVSPCEQQQECEREAITLGHKWVSWPFFFLFFFDVIAQINFSGWESLYW